jgi:hypothetical protein
MREREKERLRLEREGKGRKTLQREWVDIREREIR